MRRRILVVLLAFGAVVGYWSALTHWHGRRARMGWWDRHVAEICVDAARRGSSELPASPGSGAH